MSDEWHVLRKKEKMGPYTWEELCRAAREGAVLRGDWVYNRGLREWLLAGNLPGLFPYDESFASRPRQEYLVRRRRKIWAVAVSLAVIALVVASALLILQ